MKRLITAAVISLGIALSSAASAADGPALFKARCAPCHGPDGKGSAMGPAFVDNKSVAEGKDEEIADVIRNGVDTPQKKYKNIPVTMPKQKLTDEEMTAVIAHLRSLAGKK